MSIELTPDEFRQLAFQAVEIIAAQLETIQQNPVRRPVPKVQRDAFMKQSLPQSGVSPLELLERFVQEVQPYPMGNVSPRFMGWVNSPPAPFGIIAEFLAAAFNPSVAGGDHAATYVEHAVLKWMKEILGYPASAGAILTSGGSIANLIGLGAMRHAVTHGDVRMAGFYPSKAPMTIYISTEGHSCIQKAIELLGFGNQYLRKVPVDDEFRMDMTVLRERIYHDRQAGLQPVCVAASVGTVNTGAIDPLWQLVEFCVEEKLWLHLDASYGWAAILAEQTAELYRGIAQADSIAIDQHKWFFIPIECGCALVKDAALMRDCYSLVPPYLRDEQSLPWFSEFGIQQTRGFKALKLWMTMQQVGVDGYGELITRNIELTRLLVQKIKTRPDFEFVASGPLSIVCFRYHPSFVKNVDAFNRQLLPILMNNGRAFVTGSELNGNFALRACIVNFRTTETDLEEMLQAVIEAGEQVRTTQSLPGA